VSQIQISRIKLTNSNAPSPEAFDAHHEHIRRGDIIGITGFPARTKAGELSLQASEVKLLSPCLHQLPGREGLVDLETRYRKRYLDLIMNHETRDVFITRSKVVNYIRKFLDNLGFMEVSLALYHRVVQADK
jgi:lysyl-tRNA synthetase class 2